ncbi:uncharacterized protein BDW70DRAFT_143648 [Aspergillus foveolatus]|uniref:uncharacterized protein n=1 Tax=Aspergillus foveolatus TaxID=210207 RepID=UPI003CCCD895
MTELNSGPWTTSAAQICPNQLLAHLRRAQNLTWSIGLSIWPTIVATICACLLHFVPLARVATDRSEQLQLAHTLAATLRAVPNKSKMFRGN